MAKLVRIKGLLIGFCALFFSMSLKSISLNYSFDKLGIILIFIIVFFPVIIKYIYKPKKLKIIKI